MALLAIRKFPDPILREAARPIGGFGDDLAALVRDMTETMFHEPGVGLAAPQVGVSKHLFIVDEAIFSGQRDEKDYAVRVFINSKVTLSEGEQTDMEGCLSFPGVFEEITRPRRIAVCAQDLTGKPFELVVEGLPARAILHEVDHLEARLIIDYMSPLKRRFVRREADRGFPNAEKNREARDSIPG